MKNEKKAILFGGMKKKYFRNKKNIFESFCLFYYFFFNFMFFKIIFLIELIKIKMWKNIENAEGEIKKSVRNLFKKNLIKEFFIFFVILFIY